LSGRARPIRIAGIREIAGRFPAWFVDAYGVLHDGAAAFPGVVEALTRARQAGATIVIVTNSAQRIDAVAARLGEAGIAPGAYDHIMSSGELSWRYIEALNAEGGSPRRLFLLREGAGPFWLKDLPNPIVDEVAGADLIVAAGMPYRTEAAARSSDLMAILETGAALRAPMLVADSDETYPQNGIIRLGPGWIARRYLELGGEAIEFGKPNAPIFAAAAGLCRAAFSQAIMVGDNLATDIAGANRLGLASLMVLNGGLHGGLRDAELAEAALRQGASPTYIAPGLVW
jgi:HAD superfamily hydrolase (TIGR01459 family)